MVIKDINRNTNESQVPNNSKVREAGANFFSCLRDLLMSLLVISSGVGVPKHMTLYKIYLMDTVY